MQISEIKIGSEITVKKIMTEDLINLFSEISDDKNPIHLDNEYAKKSRYKKRLCYGMLAASLFSGIFGTKLPGLGCVYKSQSLRFLRPIHIDDLLYATAVVRDVDVKKKIVKFDTFCKVNNKKVISGSSEIFIP
jgi:3-hydroxybutyryl-CoA dehydratase